MSTIINMIPGFAGFAILAVVGLIGSGRERRTISRSSPIVLQSPLDLETS
jgi:hypothetical protein